MVSGPKTKEVRARKTYREYTTLNLGVSLGLIRRSQFSYLLTLDDLYGIQMN